MYFYYSTQLFLSRGLGNSLKAFLQIAYGLIMKHRERTWKIVIIPKTSNCLNIYCNTAFSQHSKFKTVSCVLLCWVKTNIFINQNEYILVKLNEMNTGTYMYISEVL